MSASVYLELLALSQCLPGPTSTQVSFALGVVQKGVLGGLLTGAGRMHCPCALLQATSQCRGHVKGSIVRLLMLLLLKISLPTRSPAFSTIMTATQLQRF